MIRFFLAMSPINLQKASPAKPRQAVALEREELRRHRDEVLEALKKARVDPLASR